jgi:hypothetical protein
VIHRLAVGVDKYGSGITVPGTVNPAFPTGAPQNTAGASPYYVVGEARALLEAEYTESDAHLTWTVLYDAAGEPIVFAGPNGETVRAQPRLRIDGLAYMEREGIGQGRVNVFLADIDNPGHEDWTVELVAMYHAIRARIPTAGFFATLGGFRIVQPLTAFIAWNELGGTIRKLNRVTGRDDVALHGHVGAWYQTLLDVGLSIDKKDPTRPHIDFSCYAPGQMFRPAHVKRKGKFAPDLANRFRRAKHIDLDNMRAIDPPDPIPMPEGPPASAKRGRVYSIPAGEEHTGDVTLSGWYRALRQAEQLTGEKWIGDMLAQRPGVLKVRCPLDDRHSTGQRFSSSTILYPPGRDRAPDAPGFIKCLHDGCAGASQSDMIRRLPPGCWPKGSPAESAPETPAEPKIKVEDVGPRLRVFNRKAAEQAGPHYIVIGTGGGKSYEMLVCAVERAANDLYTDIFGPTTRLTKQYESELMSLGATSVVRERGILEEDGVDCAIAQSALAFLKHTGLSVGYWICNGGKDTFDPDNPGNACPHRKVCPAHPVPTDARIKVAPHAFIGKHNEAPNDVLSFVDEAPAPVKTVVWSVAHLRRVLGNLHMIAKHSKWSVKPAIVATLALAANVVESTAFLPAIESLVPAKVDDDSYRNLETRGVIACIRKDMTGPAIPHSYIEPIRDGDKLRILRNLGEVTSLIREMRDALTSPIPARVEVRIATDLKGEGDAKEVLVTYVPKDLVDLVTGPSSTIFMGADMALKIGPYEMILHNTPGIGRTGGSFTPLADRIFRVEIADGPGGVERTIAYTRDATTTKLVDPMNGPDVDAIAGGLNIIAEVALEDPSTREVLIGTMMAVERFILAALRSEDPKTEKIRKAIGRFPKPPCFGHYGALRGFNEWGPEDARVTWATVDMIASLGDFRRPLDVVAREVEFFREVPKPSPDECAKGYRVAQDAECASEKDQLFGRGRGCRRGTKLRLLDVGAVAATEWGQDVSVRPVTLASGSWTSVPAMLAEELRECMTRFGGSPTAFALATGIPRKSLDRYLTGESTIPADVAKRARAVRLAPGVARRGGRPKNDNAMTPEELRALKEKIVGGLAKVTGKSERTIRDYTSGKTGIPASVANDIRKAAGSGGEAA